MSRIVRAPSAAIDWRSAPTRFSDPSVTWAGPRRIRSSDPTVPTLIRVPRGRVGDGAAIPQFVPRPGASSARASGEPSIRTFAPAAHPAVGDDRDVAARLSVICVAGSRDVADGGDLGHADAEDLAGRAGGAGTDTDEHGCRALLHQRVGRVAVGRVADRDRDRHEPGELVERERVVAGRKMAGARDLALDEEQVRAVLGAERPEPPGG